MAPKKKGKADPSVATAASTKATPNWPPFIPLIPTSDLSLEETLSGQIVTVPNFWTATLCKNYVSFLSSLPLVCLRSISLVSMMSRFAKPMFSRLCSQEEPWKSHGRAIPEPIANAHVDHNAWQAQERRCSPRKRPLSN